MVVASILQDVAADEAAVPAISLIAPAAGEEWRLPNGDLAATRYSRLDELTPANVGELKPVITLPTGLTNGHEGAPLVVGDTMYMVTPYPNTLIAVDLTQPGGAIKWTFDPLPQPRAVGVACCDIVNRGAAYIDGKIVFNTLDAHTVAVDARSGEERWRRRLGDIAIGETMTMAPLAVDGLVLVGNSGGEFGVRGWIAALSAADGSLRWRAYNTGPDEEVLIGEDFAPFHAKDRGTDLGAKTWPGTEWKLGGSTVWGWISYDPKARLLYYGTGNPGTWNPDVRPGDNKWSSTIIARDLDTGRARWAYQISPHDAWDYDEIMENVLVDMPWQGRMRSLLVHPGRTGFVFVLDRLSGELLSAEKYQPTNWAHGYDLDSGLPRENPAKRTGFGRITHDICPSSTGAKEVNPSALSPRTGLLYIPAHNTCMDYEATRANYIAGTPYLGASVKMYRGPGGFQGELVAWDVAAARPAWSIRETEFPLYSGVLATAGDLVFYGTMDGWFRAVHARTGEKLWEYKCTSGIVGNPMTYVGPDGRQYVAIYAGIGGWMGATAFPSISADDPYAALGVVGAMKDIKRATAPGGVLYVFAR